MVLRHFGASGIRERLAEHMRLARLFASWVDEDEEFERLAPVPFSVVCFRTRCYGDETRTDQVNERLLELVNSTGEIFLSHTRLSDGFALRLAIGNLHTTEKHVRRAWELLTHYRAQLDA
jgi:aromatic-L-amino-acid decarboxylase